MPRHSMMTLIYPARPGTRFPPGATVTADGVNFCIFSQHATGGERVLYAAADTAEAFQTVVLDPERNRSFFFWHVFVVGLPVGTYYTWRMEDPNDPALTGRRFYPHKELLDPWARAVSDRLWDRHRGWMSFSITRRRVARMVRTSVSADLATTPSTTSMQTSTSVTSTSPVA